MNFLFPTLERLESLITKFTRVTIDCKCGGDIGQCGCPNLLSDAMTQYHTLGNLETTEVCFTCGSGDWKSNIVRPASEEGVCAGPNMAGGHVSMHKTEKSVSNSSFYQEPHLQ